MSGSLLKPNPTLDHLVTYFSTVRGTDKFLMLIQYFSKIVIWHSLRKNPNSTMALKVKNLATPISDFRILLRYSGLLPMFQWILYSESNPSPNTSLQFLTRLQNIANVCYYPLEHIYWLGAHEVITLSKETLNKIGIWSCRFWAAYVVLYFIQLWEEKRLWDHKVKNLKKAKASNSISLKDFNDQKIALKEEKKTLLINTIINSAYFPLTIHWSLENSKFPDVGVGFCGTIAALAQIYTAWKATK